MITKKKLIVLLFTAASFVTKAQVNVGANSAPNTDAMLEISGSSKGLLLPRVTLSSASTASPLSSHVAGMTVYNTATAGTGTAAVTPGYYYNDGLQWQRLQAGTTPVTGDVKYGYQTVDHSGWIKLDGRAKSSLTTTQQAQATALGIGANLPDISDKTIAGVSATKTLNTTGGNSSVSLTQGNLPNVNFTGTTSTDGAHTHTYAKPYDCIDCSALAYPANNNDGNFFSATTSSSGSHFHTATVSSGGSGTTVSVQNPYLALNGFIYLGS